jgi:hypothetical protein
MNTVNQSGVNLVKTLVATTVASVLLAACAAAPLKPDGAAEARTKLTQLQSDPNLTNRAPLAIKEADAAVRAAEQPQTDKELGAYLVYMADRKVEIARAQADTSFAEDQRGALSTQREKARLDARTHEADIAEGKVATARDEAGAAHLAAANSEQQAAELQRQIDVLQAKPTDRGLVVTLGDVLFATGRADLMLGRAAHDQARPAPGQTATTDLIKPLDARRHLGQKVRGSSLFRGHAFSFPSPPSLSRIATAQKERGARARPSSLCKPWSTRHGSASSPASLSPSRKAPARSSRMPPRSAGACLPWPKAHCFSSTPDSHLPSYSLATSS